ncbi:MAG: hypothetical protein SPL28_04510 [Bacteroidales bacterium]|nr:hypothetical protein [Bacteroidales bacterium]
MKRLFKFALSVAVFAGLASCSGVSDKYPPTGDMEKDATALVQELLKDNHDQAAVEEMASSYEAYYKGEGKYEEFEKAVTEATTKEMTKQFNKIADDAVKDANEKLDEAVDDANKELDKAVKDLEK